MSPNLEFRFLRRLLWTPFVFGAWLILSCGASPVFAETSGTPRLDGEPYVNPWILNDFVGWLSDRGSIILSTDLMNAQRSNRYFGGWSLIEDDSGRTWVEARKDSDWIRYRYLGETEEGLEMVYCLTGGGGSGSFTSILLLEHVQEEQYKWDQEAGGLVSEERLILRCRGAFVPTPEWLEDVDGRRAE